MPFKREDLDKMVTDRLSPPAAPSQAPSSPLKQAIDRLKNTPKPARG